MAEQLKDKVVVITGGADGIGYQISEHYITQETKVVIILDINAEKGSAAAATLNAKYGQGKAEFIQCDVTKDLKVISKQIFDTYKVVDVLVNNAGIVDEKSARRVMEINAIAVMEWSMEFREHMRTDKGGRGGTIINIASIYGFVIDPFAVFYKSSKFAVMGFTRSLGHEQNYAIYGVRVIAICPGFTHTKLGDNEVTCWEEQSAAFNSFTKTVVWQSANDVGKAAIDVFHKAKSGTAWAVIGGVLNEVPLNNQVPY